MIQLYHGDCMDFIKSLPDKSVDLVVTDPPYLIETDGAGFFGKKYDEFTKTGKKKPVGERFVMKEIDGMKDGFSEQVLNEICRVLKQINCYFFCSQKQIPILIDFFVNKKKCNWNLLTWHKTNPMPTCGNKYLPDTEFIMFFREKGVKIFGTYETKFTYFVTLKNIKDKKQYKHPTIKPLSIVKNLIINSSIGGGLFLILSWVQEQLELQLKNLAVILSVAKYLMNISRLQVKELMEVKFRNLKQNKKNSLRKSVMNIYRGNYFNGRY